MTTFTITKPSAAADPAPISETPFADIPAEEFDAPPPGFTVPNHTASDKPEPPLKRLLTGGRPPRQRRPRRERDPAPRMPTGGLAAPLTDVYIMVGALLSPVDPVCGGAIINQAPDCAKALEKLAKTNPEVRRVLVALVSTSAWGAVITAHIPIIMAVGTHHIPALQPKPAPESSNGDRRPQDWQDGDPMPRAV